MLYIAIGMILGFFVVLVVAHIRAKTDDSRFDPNKSTELVDKQEKKPLMSFMSVGFNTKHENLELELKEALSIEDYEKAAEVRDKINKRKTKQNGR